MTSMTAIKNSETENEARRAEINTRLAELLEQEHEHQTSVVTLGQTALDSISQVVFERQSLQAELAWRDGEASVIADHRRAADEEQRERQYVRDAKKANELSEGILAAVAEGGEIFTQQIENWFERIVPAVQAFQQHRESIDQKVMVDPERHLPFEFPIRPQPINLWAFLAKLYAATFDYQLRDSSIIDGEKLLRTVVPDKTEVGHRSFEFHGVELYDKSR